MIFPVVVKRSELIPPSASLYYLVAADGIYNVRDNPIYTAVTRSVLPIPGLLPEKEHVRLKFPRLPRDLVADVVAFFAEVYRLHRGEAIVILLYDPAARELRIGAPPQVLSGRRDHTGSWRPHDAVRYGDVARPPGFVRLGTIHSHADLPAYSSPQDDLDEQFEDGLHIVIGSFGKSELTIAASFVANGIRFRVPPGTVLEMTEEPHREARPDWMACVTTEEEDDGRAP